MKHNHLVVVLAGLAMLGPFSIDTYLPSFPAVANHYGVGMADVQKTLSYYLAALAVMMLFHGALADSFGRRRVILTALAVFTMASIGCVVAPFFDWLLVCRILQGAAAGAGSTVGRAIIRDRYEGPLAHKMMAQVTMFFGIAPAIAPILGGYLHSWFNWQAVFVFLTIFGGGLLLACYRVLPETLADERRQPFHARYLFSTYLRIGQNLPFLAICMSLGFTFCAFVLYVATAPDFILNILKLNERQYAWLFVPMVTGLVLGAFISNKLALKIPVLSIARYGFTLMGTGAALNLLVNLLGIGWLLPQVLPFAIFTAGFSMQAPILTVRVLDLFPLNRGLAASLQGAIQTIMFAVTAEAIVAPVAGSGLKHAVAMACFLICGYMCWRYGRAHSHRVDD